MRLTARPSSPGMWSGPGPLLWNPGPAPAEEEQASQKNKASISSNRRRRRPTRNPLPLRSERRSAAAPGLLPPWTATAARDGCRRWASPSSASTAGWPSTAPGPTPHPSPSSPSPTSPYSSSSDASTCSSAAANRGKELSSSPSGDSPRSSRSCSHPRSPPSCRPGRTCSYGLWGSSPSPQDSTPSSSYDRRHHDHHTHMVIYSIHLRLQFAGFVVCSPTT